ncbi:MAG: hypothetical protein ACQEP3_02480 [Patescibacteria group bacterium]
MRKRLLTLILITILIVAFNIPVAAVSYSEARQDESLREAYLEELLETYPPPDGVSTRRIRYTRKDSETATMAVQYRPFMIGKDIEIILQLQLVVYPQSFEEYEVEDDFISTLFHEYNHLRAVKRDEMIEEDNSYMDAPNPFDVELAQSFQLASFNEANNEIKDNKKNFDPDVNYDLEWKDIYDLNKYDSEYIDTDEPEVSIQIIRKFVRKHIFEMLALEEEIYLHQTKLNPSFEFGSSRFEVYKKHYLHLMSNLDSLGVSEELKKSLETIFYREWIDSNSNSSLDV